MAQETMAKTRAREKMYEAVKMAIESGMTWHQVTKQLSEAWVHMCLGSD